MRWVAFSSVFAGITGYLVIFLATSTLGAERFEVFNVFWGLFFTLQGVLQGVMHETTRGVRAALATRTARTGRAEPAAPSADEGEPAPAAQTDNAQRPDSDDDPTADSLLTEPPRSEQLAAEPSERAHPARLALPLGLIAGGLVIASSPLWSGPILGEQAALGTLLLALSMAFVAVQAVLGGLLSGAGRWRFFGLFLTAEALIRVIAAGIAVVLTDPLTGFMLATVAGLLVTPPAVLLVWRRGGGLLQLRSDVRQREFIRRSLQAMLAASAAAVLVVGFPVLIKAARSDTDPVVLSNLLLAVTLTRAPILTPIISFQNPIVVYFVDRLQAGRRALWVPLAIVGGIALIGAVLAWLVGTPIIEFMGDDFSVGGQVLASLTVAAGFTGALYITGSAVLARERHTLYVAGWWVASIVAIVLLLLVDGVVVATVLALSVGPAAGALVHVLLGMRRTPAAAGGRLSLESAQENPSPATAVPEPGGRATP